MTKRSRRNLYAVVVFVAGAPKLPDGSLDVGAIQVEKEIPPPQ